MNGKCIACVPSSMFLFLSHHVHVLNILQVYSSAICDPSTKKLGRLRWGPSIKDVGFSEVWPLPSMNGFWGLGRHMAIFCSLTIKGEDTVHCPDVVVPLRGDISYMAILSVVLQLPLVHSSSLSNPLIQAQVKCLSDCNRSPLQSSLNPKP